MTDTRSGGNPWKSAVTVAALAGLLVLPACKSLDVENLNGVSAEGLQTAPTPAGVYAVAQGLMNDWRSVSGGHVNTLSKHGFELWQLRASEPRTLTNIVRDPIRGGFWSYGRVQGAVALLKAVDAVSGLTAAEKEAVRGWAKTILAVFYEDMAQAHDSFGIVLDLPADPLTEVPAIASKAQAWAKIFQLLDEAQTHLQAGGSTFPFRLTSGFAGFNTPATFLKVNRALKARYQVYQNDWNGALTSLGASFLDASASGLTTAGLQKGVYHVYSTGTGDATNPIARADMFVNTRIMTEAQKQADGTTLDLRATSKVITIPVFSFSGVSTNLKFAAFQSTTAPVPIIRNEELILLRAEANLGLGNNSLAIADINLVRAASGSLPAISDPYVPNAALGQPTTLLDELLYEKRYSLWHEIGTVWLDMRHYGKILEIPRYDPTFRLYDVFPIPEDECIQRGYSTKGCFEGGYGGV